MPRQLTAIMFADMVGYTALMQEDERRAKLLRDRQREVLEKRVAEFDGEIIQYYGDGALSGFQSAIQAVECAVALQVDLREEPQVPVRVGIHLGDVAFDKTGVYGDGVNVASRIESLSVPGGVLVSGKVADEVKNQPEISTQFLAEVALKNVKEPQRVFAVTNQDLAVPAPRELKGWKRGTGRRVAGDRGWLKWAAGGLAVLVVAGAYEIFLDGPPPPEEAASASLAPESIVIVPFDTHGLPGEAEYLGPYVTNGLARALYVGPFLPKDLATIEGQVADLRAEGLTGEPLLARLAELQRVSTVIHGDVDVSPDGSELTVTVEFFEPGAGRGARPITRVRPVEEVSDLIMSLAGRIIRERSDADPAIVGGLLPTSLEAFIAFYDADPLFRSGDYTGAVELLEEATEADSTFASAWYRLSQAYTWNWDFEDCRAPARKAHALSAELDPIQQQLLQAWLDFLNSEPLAAEERYLNLYSDHPEAEVLTGLGSVYAYFNSLLGKPSSDALVYFQQVLEIDPYYGEARYHVLDDAAKNGRRSEFYDLFDGLNPTGPQTLPFEAVGAFAFGNAAEQDAVVRKLTEAGGDPLVFAAGRVAATLHDFQGGERLGEALLNLGGLDEGRYQPAGMGLLAALAFAQGKWYDTDRYLGRLAGREEEWSLEMRTLFSVFLSYLFSGPPPGIDLGALRDSLVVWDPGEGASRPSYVQLFGPHAQHHPEFRRFLLGLISTTLGDFEDAQEANLELSNYGRSEDTQRLSHALSLSVGAHVAYARGELERSWQELEKIDYYPRFEFISVSPFFSRALDRWLRGEVLWELGRTEAALRWFNTLSDGWGEFLFAGPAHLRQAQIYEEMDSTASAIEHYREFIELWGNADPELQPLVEGARSAREALTGEG